MEQQCKYKVVLFIFYRQFLNYCTLLNNYVLCVHCTWPRQKLGCWLISSDAPSQETSSTASVQTCIIHLLQQLFQDSVNAQTSVTCFFLIPKKIVQNSHISPHCDIITGSLGRLFGPTGTFCVVEINDAHFR